MSEQLGQVTEAGRSLTSLPHRGKGGVIGLTSSEVVATGTGLTLSSGRGRWVLLAAVLGSAMASIDATVVNIALPAIGRDLRVGFASLQWTVTGYTLTLAALILLGGSLGDQFGRKRIFVVGVVWFTVASLLCALAPNVAWLISARTLQGVGGALLTPASLAIIEAGFTPGDRPRAIGAWAGLAGVASAAAPFIGGWLLHVGSWRWVFLINLPLAALVVAVAVRHVPETRDGNAVRHVDAIGATLCVLGLAGITEALIAAPEHGAGSPLVVTAGGFGLVALVLFVLAERRERHPMLPLGVFRSRQFSGTNAVTFLLYGAFGGFFFLLVIGLQVVAGYSALLAGSALLPTTILTLLLSARSGQLAERIGPRLQMTAGPLICAAGLLLALRLGRSASYVTGVLPAVTVFGLGLACLVAPLTATALSSAPEEHAGVASGVNNAVARAASLIAIAALPAASGLTGRAYTEPSLFVAGFHRALWICIAALLVGAALAAVLISNRRDISVPVDPALPPPATE